MSSSSKLKGQTPKAIIPRKKYKVCCVINCNNNLKSIDKRTNKHVKLHGFPDSTKERERCLKWIINSRRADLSIKTINTHKVCSTHFEASMYSCPTNIADSRLLPTALPTIIDCPNPPKPISSVRKTGTKRKLIAICESPQKKKIIRIINDTNVDNAIIDETIDSVKRKLLHVEADVKRQKTLNKILQQKVKRLQVCVVNCKKTIRNLQQNVTEVKKCTLESIVNNFPPVPAALFQVLDRKKKKILWCKEKVAMELCLSVFFRSPSAYSILRVSGFQLPHPATLRRQYRDVLRSPGLCPVLIDMLRVRALALQEHEKRVTLSLDGMTLKQGITFDKANDELKGFVDCGSYGQRMDVADQGVLLMVRGLSLKWKQIIGFYITQHTIKTDMLSNIIKNAVSTLYHIGLTVDCIVMDQESCQWKWVETMGVSPKQPFVSLGELEPFIIPDPPHLIKNLRNNFMTKDIQFTLDGQTMTAKWSHLQTLYEIDRLGQVRTIPKWNDNHFTLPRGKKMKVILACQIFSHSAAAAMKYYVSLKALPDEAMQTAVFLETVNSMWDFVDSSNLNASAFKKPITAKTIDQDLSRFDYFYDFVASWQFLKNQKVKILPSHKGWLLALKAMYSLSVRLIKEKKLLTYLCLRKCNQDHLENMHSQIRGYNGFNDHPTVTAYISALRCLSCKFSTTELLDKNISLGANCSENDFDVDTNNTSVVIESRLNQENLVVCEIGVESEVVRNLDFPQNNVDYDNESRENLVDKIQSDIVSNIAGSIVQKICSDRNDLGLCEGCSQLLLDFSYSTENSLITYKEYKPGALTRVSEPVSQLCNTFEIYFQSVAKSSLSGLPMKSPMKTILRNFMTTLLFDSSLNCINNHVPLLNEAILRKYCTIRLFHEVKIFNQNLLKKKKGSELNKCKKLNM